MKEEALKLADELDALHQYVPSEAPAMIRRLVEELDALNAKESFWQEMIEDLECQVLTYKQGEPVARLNIGRYGVEVDWFMPPQHVEMLCDGTLLYTTPQTKQGEPVAWIIQSKYGTPQLNWDSRYRVRYDSTVVKQASIPLYTTPQTKPLSDEEILAIADKFIERFEYEPCNVDEIGFARAIEERHGIK